MTNSDPDQIRADIERTRSELGSDVDALADKVTPSKIAHRQTEKVKGVFSSWTDRIMGTTRDPTSDMGDAITGAPHKAVEGAKGNPLAVGLIAFGAGWLLASLIPASTREKEMAETIKEAAEPTLKNAATEMADNLREPAQDAVNAVKDSATDGFEAVKEETTSASSDLTDQVKGAAQTAQESAKKDGSAP